MAKKLFIIAPVHGDDVGDAEYMVLQLTPEQAQLWLDAMGAVKTLQVASPFQRAVGSVYGVECFFPSTWMSDQEDKLPDQVLLLDGGAVLAGEPADYGLVASVQAFDCETVTITDSGMTFKNYFKYSDSPASIECWIDCGVFESAAKGETDEVEDADQEPD